MSTVAVVEAQSTMVTSSQEHDWQIPEVDSDKDEWGGYLNDTLRALDKEVVLKGTFGERPGAGRSGRWYLATNTGVLYFDNGSSWETIIGRDMPDTDFRIQRAITGDGTAGNPAFTYDADGDTGMYRTADNTLSFSTAGNEGLRITPAQDVRIQNGDLVDNAGNVIYDQSNKYIPQDRLDTAGIDAGTLAGAEPSYYRDHTNATNVGAEDHHNTVAIEASGSQVIDHPQGINFGPGLSASLSESSTDTVVVSTDENTPVAQGNITLTAGKGLIDTGVTTTGTLLDVMLDPSGGGANNADVKVAARAYWDDGAGEYKVEIVEDGTNIGNPTIGYEVVTS